MPILYDSAAGSEIQAINIRSYGAIGDGVADDTAAVQAAGTTMWLKEPGSSSTGWTAK